MKLDRLGVRFWPLTAERRRTSYAFDRPEAGPNDMFWMEFTNAQEV